MGAILKEAIRVPSLGGCVTSSSSCDSPRIAVPFGPVLHDVLSGHLNGLKGHAVDARQPRAWVPGSQSCHGSRRDLSIGVRYVRVPMLRLDFLGRFDVADMLMLAASVVVVVTT
jgi:hypothetical protein